MDVKSEIIRECAKAMERLGAQSDLLSTIQSYGDTLSDEEVLMYLRELNEFHAKDVSPEADR